MVRRLNGIEDLHARLSSLAEELGDRAFDCLRQAAEDPAERERLLAEERRLTRARRAVEKAAALLGGNDGDSVIP